MRSIVSNDTRNIIIIFFTDKRTKAGAQENDEEEEKKIVHKIGTKCVTVSLRRYNNYLPLWFWLLFTEHDARL